MNVQAMITKKNKSALANKSALEKRLLVLKASPSLNNYVQLTTSIHIVYPFDSSCAHAAVYHVYLYVSVSCGKTEKIST
jgi:hypothetical protein